MQILSSFLLVTLVGSVGTGDETGEAPAESFFVTSLEGGGMTVTSRQWSGTFENDQRETIVDLQYVNRNSIKLRLQTPEHSRVIRISLGKMYTFSDKFNSSKADGVYSFYFGLDHAEGKTATSTVPCQVDNDDRLSFEITENGSVHARLVRLAGCVGKELVLQVRDDDKKHIQHVTLP